MRIPEGAREPVTGAPVKVPHIGWNRLDLARSGAGPLAVCDADPPYVYFVHSYCAPVNENTVAATTYGERFAAIVRNGNVFGAQFHPERSARAGALVLRNFLLVS